MTTASSRQDNNRATSLSYLDRAAAVDRVRCRGFCQRVMEVLCVVAVLLADLIIRLSYIHVVQWWRKRIPILPLDIALVIGCGELNLTIGRNGANIRSGIGASHTDFQRTGSYFNGERSVGSPAHADVVIHGDAGSLGSLRIAGIVNQVDDIVEDLLVPDCSPGKGDRNGRASIVVECDALPIFDLTAG